MSKILKLEDYNNGLVYTKIKGCIECNKCIHECPILKSNVSVINNEGRYKICVDQKECILCGTCIDTCVHDARHFIDDSQDFIKSMKQGKKFSVLVAPAFYLNYPNEAPHVLGYLKSLGAVNFYAVGFGADIATWAYLNYLDQHRGTPYIAQPCPTIVSHIEKHLPAILPNLIPVQSPLLCTAIYLKQYKNIEEDLVFLSPCIAKKIEIQSPRSMGLIRYNVTFHNLINHIKAQGVNLYDYPQASPAAKIPNFDDKTYSGLGAIFPKPGGLSENIECYLGPQAEITQVAGKQKAYKYLKSFASRVGEESACLPMLVDIINCEMGCSFGTGVGQRLYYEDDITLQTLKLRKKKLDAMKDPNNNVMLEPKRRLAMLNEKFKELKLNDFICTYDNTQAIHTRVIPEAEIDAIFTNNLEKFSLEDKRIDCSACGYKTCQEMATAIAHGINHADNCVYYLKNSLVRSMEENQNNNRIIQKRLKAMLDASPILCAIYDENYKVIEVNQAAADLFGVSDKQVYAERLLELCPEFQPCGTPTRDKVQQVLKEAFNTGRCHFEWMHQTLDGKTLIPCEVYLEQVFLEKKNVVIAYVRDLREEKLRKTVELENQAKSRFLARMSHEIRTPITAVLGIAEIELQSSNLPPKLEEAFAKIYNSSDLLLGIINDILDLSRIEAGKMTLLYEDYNLADVIRNVAHLHLASFATKGIGLILNVDENLPVTLTGDFVRIEQIMNNLLSNALKFTDSGSAQLSFSCRKNEEKGYVTLVIEVSDTGFGLTQEQLALMRNESEYVRHHETKRPYISGTGLGMPIVYNLLEMMNGKIDLESEVGKGTKVTVYIPQKISGSEVLGKETARTLESFKVNASFMAQRFKFTPESMPYGKVLIVDDVETNLYVAKGLLNFYELNIETCESGQEAIDKVKAGNVYDIIFMDQMMPSLNGDETMRILRSMGYTHPIVALTANALIGQAERFIKDGFDGFISKPIQTKLLNSILVKFIKDKQPKSVIEAVKVMMPAEKDNNKKVNNDYLSDPELNAILKQKFVKNHKNIIADITDALEQDDIKTAHRLAHTLKSSANLINEDILSSAAKDVEIILAKKDRPAVEQLLVLEKELEKVLKKIDVPNTSFAGSDKNFNKAALFDKLAPLLEARDSEALNFLDNLRLIPEASPIAEQIEKFNFADALNNLNALRNE